MTETPETLWVTFDPDGNTDDCTPDQQGAYDYARRSDYSSPVPYVLKEKLDALTAELTEERRGHANTARKLADMLASKATPYLDDVMSDDYPPKAILEFLARSMQSLRRRREELIMRRWRRGPKAPDEAELRQIDASLRRRKHMLER